MRSNTNSEPQGSEEQHLTFAISSNNVRLTDSQGCFSNKPTRVSQSCDNLNIVNFMIQLMLNLKVILCKQVLRKNGIVLHNITHAFHFDYLKIK